MYDPKREYHFHKREIDESIQSVLNHGLFINGPEVKSLEPKLAEFVGSKYAITCSNGTDALKVALLAVGVKFPDGDTFVYIPSNNTITSSLSIELTLLCIFIFSLASFKNVILELKANLIDLSVIAIVVSVPF